MSFPVFAGFFLHKPFRRYPVGLTKSFSRLCLWGQLRRLCTWHQALRTRAWQVLRYLRKIAKTSSKILQKSMLIFCHSLG